MAIKFLLRIFLWLVIVMGGAAASSKDRKLLVVMVDGLANWVLNTELENSDTGMTGFRKLKENGIQAKYLLPEFPSLRLPNYQSFATGKFVKNHNIIGNYMYNIKDRKFFNNLQSYNDHDISWWDSADPVWVTAARQDVKTALYWWPGCNVQYGGLNLTGLCPKTVHDASGASNILDQIPEILRRMSHENLRLVLISYTAVLQASKEFGPASGSAATKIEEISDILFKLQEAMESFSLFDSVNLLVVSSQGMSAVSLESSLYFLDDYIDTGDLLDVVVDNGSWMLIFPKSGKDYQTVQEIRAIPHTKVFWRDQILTRWELKGALHLPPIMLVCDQGYGIYCRNCGEKQYPRISKRVRDHLSKGISGYDNDVQEMQGILLARGPNFLSTSEFNGRTWLRMVDMHGVMCSILGLSCPDDDGSSARIYQLLNLAHRVPSFSLPVLLSIVISLTYSQVYKEI